MTDFIHEIRSMRPGIDTLPQPITGLNPVLIGCEKCGTTIYKVETPWLDLGPGDVVKWLCTNCMSPPRKPRRRRKRPE